MYGISRAIGSRDGPGWIVTIKRNGAKYSKPFPFSMLGGEEAALIRAQAWRDEIVKAHPPASRQQRATQLRSTNKSGIAGVSCLRDPDGNPRSWVARTQISPDKVLSAKFSVRRYGEDEAKLLALAARQKQLRQLTGLAFVHPSEAMLREAAPRPIPPNLPAPLAYRESLRKSTNPSGLPSVRRIEPKKWCPGYWGAITASGIGRKSLTKFFSIKTYGEEMAKELAIAERQHVRVALGLHPQLVGERESVIGLFESLLSESRYGGEVGLDASPRFYKSFAAQERVFERVLRACAKHGGKILTVHSVRSISKVLAHVEKSLPPGRGHVVLHWFAGSLSEARRAVDLGCYFSINSEMLKGPRHRALVEQLPVERILTETDTHGNYGSPGYDCRRARFFLAALHFATM